MLLRLNAAVERAVGAPPAQSEEALRLHRLRLTTLERRLAELEQIMQQLNISPEELEAAIEQELGVASRD